ncbi:toll/interleukin-1 receptor domain-containing protein [Aeromicrobium wangtongii]|uniref:Toll/interleukin-1 receptor domain-containing protein n=1 Tax=Aeromicrobium wangtongii TaxID=2969247 RepID=A0ABY5MEZ2_9ACTN|nr:toll/interleukin-1 receptor domain-containing protein [Aeromicrobium wangtongii]MCD9197801.1 toll/interleukin-1 receptor domain-containing protein [Aeromicrobium wangtongii]UUP15283.1 toll/interleukin-1 receptor domain-containing protein [Aeromicrobium wangtongii]
MAQCTAPVEGHRTSSGAANCPACSGRSSYRSYSSYYSPPSYYSLPGSSRGSGSLSGGGNSNSGRPRWSPANSSVSYTSDEVAALDRYRDTVEGAGPRAVSYDLFLCHAWDDRRETATELHDLLEAEGVSVWFSEKDILLGQPFMREIDKGLAKTRIGLVLITPAFLKRIDSGGVSEKELSELLSRDLLIPVAHGVTYDEIRTVSPLLGSRNGLSTEEDSIENIAKKITELVAV